MRLACVRPCGAVAVFCLRSRLLFVLRQTGRLAIACVPVPRVEIAICAFSMRRRGYLPWRVHFGFECFFMAISTGLRGDEDRGKRDWRRGLCAFLRSRIGFEILSAGSTLGLRAPDCAKESNVEAALPPLWTLFTLRQGCVGAYSQRRHPGTRVDPPGSDLWSGGSCCISMLSTRTIEDLPNSKLWFGKSCGIARQQVEAAPPPGCVREAEWKPHSGREAVWKPALPAGLP